MTARLVAGRRLWAVLAGALLLLIGGSSAASGARAPRAARPAADAPIAFSHAVVVDQQRPGFEPDVKVDGNGVIYSSVPFGFSTTQSFVWSSRDHGNSYQFVPGNIGPGSRRPASAGATPTCSSTPATPSTSPTSRA